MKLKNMLMISFFGLTIIPILIVSVLLYKSGFSLSKESYTQNLTESLNVQADYIAQTIGNNMISDYRFASKTITTMQATSDLHTAITAYLGTAEDEIAVCILLDEAHTPIYSIGEKTVSDIILAQLPKPSEFASQAVLEFDLGDEMHSLGIVTPVWEQGRYMGCLVSVYDKSYIFKIISSYYETADASTYICRENGDIINSRQLPSESNAVMQEILHEIKFSSEGAIKKSAVNSSLLGYYKNIYNTPWYLVGCVDDALIYSFANQFLLVYFMIIFAVLFIDILLSIYVSRKVVKPINSLIKVMEGYQNSLDGNELQCQEEDGYVETKYLRTKFLELMKKILLVQHNFEGIYQLYQSNDMGDINIDIDVTNQTIACNKKSFQTLIHEISVPSGACVVEKFTGCFCDEDQRILTSMFEEMRDEHLSITQEAEVYTPYLDEKYFHSLVVPMYTNERLSRLFVQLRDVSSFKKQELESSEQAKRDSLTGLYNRAGFIHRVEMVMQASNEKDVHALLFIDIDYFKMVNDNFGHTAGDELLQTVGKTLLAASGQNDVVSRFGGDEFVMFLTSTSQELIEKMQRTIKEQLIYPFDNGKISFVVSASAGISVWQQNSPHDLKELLKQADAAMYEAKRAFKEGTNV